MERTKYTPKRLLSLLLALIMLLGMFPTAVFAAGETAKQIVLSVLLSSATTRFVVIGSNPLSAHSTEAKKDFMSITKYTLCLLFSIYLLQFY